MRICATILTVKLRTAFLLEFGKDGGSHLQFRVAGFVQKQEQLVIVLLCKQVVSKENH